MKRTAYTRPDGGVSVVVPSPRAQRPDESEADFLSRVARAVPPDATDVVQLDTLPSRAYRNAWVLAGGKVQHDMDKARAMKLEEIRAERNARLAASDGPHLRAQDQGDTAEVNRLKVLRQRLRDLPATVDLSGVSDADALAAWQPEWPE